MHLVVSLVIFVTLAINVEGHGRFIEPPSRASAWRYGFNTPVNYNDNALYCGGFSVQWYQNVGKCGICGDSWQGPRDHEAGGRYATGTITRTYRQGSTIQVTVHLTANHKGWFEFRLCPHNDPMTPARQACFDENLLKLHTGATRFTVLTGMSLIGLQLKLPAQVTCTQCILQWKYNTGNSWGNDFETGKGCIGCGPQEQFYGCADIAIERTGVQTTHHLTTQRQTTRSPYTRRTTTRQKPTWRPTTRWPTTYRPPGRRCHPVGQWVVLPGMVDWCTNNCAMGHCPPNMCICTV